MLSKWKFFFTHGLAKKVKATGAGSANPVVSKMMLSYGCPAVEDRRLSSASAVRISLRREQQIHPLDMVTRSSLERNWLETADVNTMLRKLNRQQACPTSRTDRFLIFAHAHRRAASGQRVKIEIRQKIGVVIPESISMRFVNTL